MDFTSLGGRRFFLTCLVGGGSALLCFLEKLSGAEYASIVIAINLAYLGAGTFTNHFDTKAESK